MKEPDKINVFGTRFSILNLEKGIKFLNNWNPVQPEYICFPSTNTISKAYKNKNFQNVINNSAITFVDGKFTEFYVRFKGHKDIKSVSGYWLMEKLLKTDRTHYFYGCDVNILDKLKENLLKRFPNARILGFKSPPFVELKEIYPNDQIISDFMEINRLKPDFIWIGISTVKQDYLMYHYKQFLDNGVMLGVGAVFLYHAGVVKKGAEIFKKLGLRWILRIAQEPRRLWKSTVPSLLYFIMLVIKYDILKYTKRYHKYD